MSTTIDKMLELLQQQKDAGVPGDTRLFIPGSGGYLYAIKTVTPASVATPDHKNGKSHCKLVANRGAQVLLISN